jgi:endothelin-converting enzyme/putative endopeptidase
LYKTILDTIGRNKLGITPLNPTWKNWCKKHKDLQALLIEMEPLGGIGFLQKPMLKTVIEM